jgi:hypothetical protein
VYSVQLLFFDGAVCADYNIREMSASKYCTILDRGQLVNSVHKLYYELDATSIIQTLKVTPKLSLNIKI